MRLLATTHLAVGALEPVKFPVIVKGRRLRPYPPHNFHVLIGPPVPGVVVQPVPVLPLLRIAAPGDDVHCHPAPGELVQRRSLPGGQRRCHKPRTMGNQEPQPLGAARGVTGDFKPVGGAGRVTGQHHIETGGFVGPRELGDVLWIHPGGNFPSRVDSPAKNTQARPRGGRVLPLHPNHPNHFDRSCLGPHSRQTVLPRQLSASLNFSESSTEER